MDGVSFVLGLNARQLRGAVLKDLIYKKDANSPPARKASVTLIYVEDSGAKLRFTRSISAAGVGSYRLNNKEVTYDAYEEVLQKIGVLVKARNFLVFQGDVESVASKSPTELTKLIEQISGSVQYVAEYEDLLRRKEEAEEKAIFSMQKKKMYSTQRKEVKDQKEEAEDFQAKQFRLGDLKTQHLLWKILKIKTSMETHDSNIESSRRDLGLAEMKDAQLKEELEDFKKDLARANKQLSSAEKDLAAKQKKLSSILPQVAESAGRNKSLGRRVTELTKSRDLIAEDIRLQKAHLVRIHRELASIVKAEEEAKTKLESTEMKGIVLSPAQAKDYGKLKEQAAAEVSTLKSQEQLLEMECRSKQHALELLTTEEKALETELGLNEELRLESSTRQEKLLQAVEAAKAEESDLKRRSEALQKVVAQSEGQLKSLQNELENVNSRLQDAGDDRRRSKQEEKVLDAIASMQKIFPGVRGR